jgi:hypothetical protein
VKDKHTTITGFFRFGTLAALMAVIGMSFSCMTTYDARGNPMQTVDPAVAIAGVAAAGLVGYALANDNGSSSHSHYSNHTYYGGGGYHHGGYYHSEMAYNPCY